MTHSNGMSMTLAEDSLLGPPITPLPDEITTAAARYVVAHGGADVLEQLGLDGVA